MGWERKRGKLHELNRLLRGATDTTFLAAGGRSPVGPCRRALRHHARCRHAAAARGGAALVGTMAHPLNRPRFDPRSGPRRRGLRDAAAARHAVAAVGREGSLFQRIFSGPGGIDPYASAVSDVYQDLFGEGSFTGKGIYDVDAFEAALAGRVPENTLLSHDLFEGIFARAGLVTDIEVFEEFPSRLRRRGRAPAPLGARRLAAAAVDLRSGSTARPARRSRCSAAGRCSTTCAARCRRRPPSSPWSPAGRCRSTPPRCGRAFVARDDRAARPSAGLSRDSCRDGIGISKRSHVARVGGDLAAGAVAQIALHRSPSSRIRPG